MTRVRLGAVEYLNARPLVYGLPPERFDLRFDVPSRCAALLHAGQIDLGLIPSIEYLQGPAPYRIVPGVAIASKGPVASVALFTRKAVADVRSIAMDTSSRTSVALVRVLCARRFGIDPKLEPSGPDLDAMLERCDAALIIGDKALFLAPRQVFPSEKIDLGDVWTAMTGLPFVWAFWAGPAGVLGAGDAAALQQAKAQGLRNVDAIAAEYCAGSAERVRQGAGYLRDNIKYDLGAAEREGLELFYRYAAEAGVVGRNAAIDFFESDR